MAVLDLLADVVLTAAGTAPRGMKLRLIRAVDGGIGRPAEYNIRQVGAVGVKGRRGAASPSQGEEPGVTQQIAKLRGVLASVRHRPHCSPALALPLPPPIYFC